MSRQRSARSSARTRAASRTPGTVRVTARRVQSGDTYTMAGQDPATVISAVTYGDDLTVLVLQRVDGGFQCRECQPSDRILLSISPSTSSSANRRRATNDYVPGVFVPGFAQG